MTIVFKNSFFVYFFGILFFCFAQGLRAEPRVGVSGAKKAQLLENFARGKRLSQADLDGTRIKFEEKREPLDEQLALRFFHDERLIDRHGVAKRYAEKVGLLPQGLGEADLLRAQAHPNVMGPAIQMAQQKMDRDLPTSDVDEIASLAKKVAESIAARRALAEAARLKEENPVDLDQARRLLRKDTFHFSKMSKNSIVRKKHLKGGLDDDGHVRELRDELERASKSGERSALERTSTTGQEGWDSVLKKGRERVEVTADDVANGSRSNSGIPESVRKRMQERAQTQASNDSNRTNFEQVKEEALLEEILEVLRYARDHETGHTSDEFQKFVDQKIKEIAKASFPPSFDETMNRQRRGDWLTQINAPTTKRNSEVVVDLLDRVRNGDLLRSVIERGLERDPAQELPRDSENVDEAPFR